MAHIAVFLGPLFPIRERHMPGGGVPPEADGHPGRQLVGNPRPSARPAKQRDLSCRHLAHRRQERVLWSIGSQQLALAHFAGANVSMAARNTSGALDACRAALSNRSPQPRLFDRPLLLQLS